MDFRSLTRAIGRFASSHSTAILSGLGIAGFVTTVAMVAKAAPIAREVHEIETWNRTEGIQGLEEEQAKEAVRESYISEAKDLLPLYGPPAAVGVASVACFLMASKVQADRRAAVMAAYSLSTDTLSRYQEKVIERLGEDEHKEILRDISKEHVREKVPDGYDPNLEVMPAGKVRVYDSVTGRYFYSTKEDIYEAESTINQMLIDQAIVRHHEFYYLLGLEESYALGEAMGWDISSNGGASSLRVWLSPHLDDDKNPCLCLNYHVTIFDRSA